MNGGSAAMAGRITALADNCSRRKPGRRATTNLGTELTMSLEKIRERERDLKAWLRENAPEVAQEQKHLDADTEARAYWHFGYAMALEDVLALLSGERADLIH